MPDSFGGPLVMIEPSERRTEAPNVPVASWLRRPAPSSSFRRPDPPDSRGFQAHVPWTDSTIYFDTTGCCGPQGRISAPMETIAWRFTLVAASAGQPVVASPWPRGVLMAQPIRGPPVPARHRR